jgi:predicted MPP superfamily phosphohydrolase
MDHQPIRLKEAAACGVTLQVSGHTHHGQLWPVSLLTRALYECDWGYLRKGVTQFYVSCGAGTWGPPVRTSCRPEVALLDLHFTGNQDNHGRSDT